MEKAKCPHCGYVNWFEDGDLEQCACCGETYYIRGDDRDTRGEYED